MRELLNLSARLRLQKGSFWLIISVILIINGCIAPSRSNFQATNFYTSFSVWKAMYLTSKREKATPSLKINELCFVHSLFLHEKKNSIDRYLMNIPHTRYLRPLFFFLWNCVITCLSRICQPCCHPRMPICLLWTINFRFKQTVPCESLIWIATTYDLDNKQLQTITLCL